MLQPNVTTLLQHYQSQRYSYQSPNSLLLMSRITTEADIGKNQQEATGGTSKAQPRTNNNQHENSKISDQHDNNNTSIGTYCMKKSLFLSLSLSSIDALESLSRRINEQAVVSQEQKTSRMVVHVLFLSSSNNNMTVCISFFFSFFFVSLSSLSPLLFSLSLSLSLSL